MPKLVLVELACLHSPRATISRSDPRHRFDELEKAMKTPGGKSRIPPIDLQPLGVSGQPAAIPLDLVVILN